MPTAEEVTTQALSEFIAALSTVEAKDDAAFTRLVATGVDLLRLVDRDIAHEFEVSLPTVTRWRNGTNAPHPAMRKHVYGWLKDRASAILRPPQHDATDTDVAH